VSSVNEKDETPLHKACKRGHLEIANLLLQHGANMEQKNKKFCHTALHLSVINGHSDVACLLMSKGANLFALDASQFSIVHRSLWSKNQKMAKIILDYFHGRGLVSELDKLVRIPDENRNTCLHSACLSGRADLACILIDKGSDLRAVNTDGETALHMACQTGLCQETTAERQKIVEHLIRKGALINAQDNSGKTPLHYAASNDALLLVKCLVYNNADINVQNKNGQTPLHLAQEADVVDFLLDNRASADVQDGCGSTPLHVAASNVKNEDSLLLVKCLVRYKANVNDQNLKGETPLHLAHKPDVINFLLKNGATIDVRDHSGSTPLHIAASKDALLLVQCLVNNEADINVQNLRGETPLDLAHKADVFTFLLKNGAKYQMQDINIYFYTNSQSSS
jgi:ankyrin repeat protein